MVNIGLFGRPTRLLFLSERLEIGYFVEELDFLAVILGLEADIL